MQEKKVEEIREAFSGLDLYEIPDDDNLFQVTRWSDGLDHQYINLTMEKSKLKRERGGMRMFKRLNRFPTKVLHNKLCYVRYLAVDEIEYFQGWFLKNKFHEKRFWTVYATTREEMNRFFTRYINMNDKLRRGKDLIQIFNRSWKDGMLFACYW